jgi:hypothetical protein
MTHHRRHKYSFGNFLHDIGPGTKEIGKLFDKAINVSGRVATAGVHELGSVSNGLINKTSGLLGQISLPLIIVGGIIGYVVLTKK